MNDWIIIPEYHAQPFISSLFPKKWVLYRLASRIGKQDYARNEQGQVRTFTTRSGARGVRSRLRHSGEMSA